MRSRQGFSDGEKDSIQAAHGQEASADEEKGLQVSRARGEVAEPRREVCTPGGTTIVRANYHILSCMSMKQSVRNITQPMSEQTNGEEHAHVHDCMMY